MTEKHAHSRPPPLSERSKPASVLAASAAAHPAEATVPAFGRARPAGAAGSRRLLSSVESVVAADRSKFLPSRPLNPTNMAYRLSVTSALCCVAACGASPSGGDVSGAGGSTTSVAGAAADGGTSSSLSGGSAPSSSAGGRAGTSGADSGGTGGSAASGGSASGGPGGG